jgi:type I restriction enzyme S subunit
MANGWQIVPLGEFLTQRKEFFTIDDFTRYKRARVQSHGKGIVLRDEVTGAEIKTKKQQAARTGEFLVAEIDAKVGGFGIVPPVLDSAVVSSHYFLFQIDENKCSQEWLNWFVRYNSLEEQTKAQGSTNYAAIRPNDVLNFEIPLPPLTEQRRIVARIEALAARVAQAQSLRREASEEADLLIGREIAALFTNAKGWYSYNLGDLISEMCYGTSEKAHSDRDGVPVLRMGNIQNGKLDLSDLKYMHPAEQEMRKLRLQKGDILVNRTNSAELVGKCAVFDLEGDYLFASYIIRIRLNQQKAEPCLVAQFINSPIGRAYMFSERKQMTGQANVNSKKLAALPIKLPSLEEQRRLVAYLDGLQAQVSALRAAQSATQKELDALLPSILDQAFKGEL